MARDYFDESKNKKKKKEIAQPQKVTKSPSVSQTNKNVNKKASNSTFMGGGSAARNTEKTVSKSTTNKPQSFSSNNQPVKRQPAGRTASARLTTAQRQKMGLNDQFTAEERQSWREKSLARQEQARTKKMGLAPEDQPTAEQKKSANRALKKTPALMKESAKGAAYGHLTTLNDIASIKSQGNGKSREEIYDPNLAERSRQQAEQRVKKLQGKTQETEDAIQKLTKNAKGLEKAYYGAVESGTGMLTDIGVGALTGTGQVGSLAAMFSRTYGSTRGKAQQEGATQAEDRAYAAAQAAKEVGTELMFPGAGLARGYAGKTGLSLADTAANILTKNLRGKAADIGGAGVRLLGGVLEENAEEFAGWGLDPLIKEITYGKNARTRNAQQAMKERSNALRAEIQNEDDARAAAAYLSSDDFFEQTVNAYREAGLSKKDAEEVADRMRDYLTASLTGDTDSMEQIEDEVSKRVAGSKKLEWDFDELKDTIASTTLLTAATGLPGTGMTAVKGAALRDQLGDDGVRALANTAIDFEDGEMSLKAKAMKARLDSGNELTSTQVYDLQVGMQEQIRKDTQREESSRRMADKRIKSDNLIAPYRQNENGGIDLDEATEASYREHVSKAKDIIDGLTSETKESLTANEKVDGSKAIAGFQTGVFTIEDANTLNYSNTTVRAAFEEATGVDLGQYVVKNKDGSVNIPATNTKTKDALFAMAADNLVKSAQAETANWMDNTKGQVVTQVSARMGAQGSAVLQQALDDVDERDRSKYMMTANATDMLYQAARNMGTEWSDVASEATKMFPGISESKLKMMYEAGLADREMANDKARGRQVRMGQALTEMGEQETATGKVFIDTEVPVKGSVIRTFTEIAKNLGADIHFVDYIYDSENNPIAGANGSYDPNTNTFYLNVATGAETNIGYIFMHETTHYLKTYAPEQYQALENLVRERWFAFNPSQMQDAIARKIEAYKRATKGQQVLTEEQALEEIIADASHDFINDPEFAKQVAEEDMGLAKAVLDSIRNALRMLRRIFASGSINDDTHMNSLFRELDIMAEAEKLWLDAYKVAVRNSSLAAVNEWQDNANSYSISEGKKSNSAEAKWERGEKLTKAKFNSFYSAHKLTYGRATKDNIDDVVEKIKTDGFISTTAIANVVPASINDYVNPEKPNLTQSKYGAKAGDVVMFVPNKYVDLKNDIIKNGYKPRDYEIVEVERDYQPYYEMYSKAYDESQTRYSISFNDKLFDELNDAEQSVIHEAVSPDIRFSMPTERDVLPKARYKSDIGFSNAISAISGKQARINALEKNGFSKKQAEQIGEAISNVILDTGNWIEGDLQSEFTFIGWDDLINAEVSVRKDWKGKVVGVSVSAMVANGEYPVNFDLTTICNKREGIMQVIQNLTRIKTDTGKSVLDSVKLTDQDMWNINKALKAEGIDTACLGCFVEARRYYTNRFIASIDNKWNTAVRETRRQLGLPEEEYFNFAHGKKVTGEDYTAISDLWTSYEKSKDTKKSPEQRIRILMNEIIKNNEVDSPYLKLVSASDILTPEGISGLKQISTGKHDLVKTLKSIYGTSAPKEILAFTPYNSEIALLPKNLKGQRTDKYLRSIGGIRIQSFSDFKIEHVIDHMQMVADMAARKFTCHAYSKVIAFPRIFGLSGQKINMSVMFDITPAEEWQKMLGCSEEKAKEYAFKYAGLRFVQEKPTENPDNRPYIETELEGVHGYLTYLLGDADYINSVYEDEYQKNIAAGMDENEAKRKANEAKPFEQSINYREAVELENQDGYKENVGIIAVAYGDEHLKILLADPNVRYVIPYHKSGLPVFVSEKTSLQYARNYEPVQNTKKADPAEKLQERYEAFKKTYKGEYPAIAFFGDIYEKGGSIATTEATATEAAKLHGTGEFDVYKDLDKAKDIKEVSNAYLEDCIENNLVPVFSEFAGDPNYYKMLFDFAVTDAEGNIYPQKTVRNNYPGIDIDAKIAAGEKITDNDYAKLHEAIRKGAAEENAKNQTRSENMQNVLDDILSKDSENSILAGTNVNALRDSATDYTNPKGVMYSITPEMDEAYMDAYFDGDDDAMQELVDEAAYRAGYTYKAYHHTEFAFTVFDRSKARRSMDIQGFYFSADPEAEREYGSVRYDVFLKIDNPYVIDSSEAMKALPFDYGTENAGVKAREWLQENGYDAVIRDAEYYGAEADEIIVFESGQIKSSEPMLFEDDPNGEYGEGDVIPLSQRFDPSNPDIRYSLPTQDTDGNILTDGQMEYFKNSQARDSQGRLVPVYHTTNHGGFTIFDPMRSDDHRSLFFTNSRSMSASYSKRDGRIPSLIDPYNITAPNTTIDDVGKLPDFGDVDVSVPDIVSRISNIKVVDGVGNEVASGDSFVDVAIAVGRYLENKGYDLSDDFAVDPYLLDTEHAWGSKEGDAWDLYNELRNVGLKYTMDFADPVSTYITYLNLENPLIIEGNGQEWDAISLDTKLPKDCHLELYTSEYLLDKAKNDDYLYGIGQSHRDGSKPREYGTRAKKNGEVVLKFETGEWISAKDDSDAIGKAINQHYGIDETDPTGRILADFFMQSIQKSGRKSYQKWINESLMKELTSETHDTREWAEIAQYQGYDGVIFRDIVDYGDWDYGYEPADVYVAFSSNQVKDINNENPTENPDIRYSIPDENEVKEYVAQTADNIDDIPLSDAVLEQNRQNHIASAATFQNSIVSSWSKRTLNLETKKKTPLKNQLISLMKAVRKDSNTERQYKTETLDETIKSTENMYAFAKKDNAQAFAKEAWDAAERIVDDIDYNDDLYEKYKEMQTFFERNKIAPPSELYADEVYGEFKTFKRENDGKIRWATHALQDLQGDETELDVAYRILHREYPMFFTEAYSDNPIDQLMQIAAALNNTDAYRDAYTSEEHAKLVENIANNLCDIVSEGNEYRATIDELRVKAMKQRHEEALRKVREERNAIADSERNRANRWKQKYNDRIQKEKAERNEKADKREHLKSFGHIEKNYNKLCTWVLNPTKEKNVPEEFRKSLADFLQALDLQTENSKKLETKTGRVAQKTLKMRELKDRLNDLSTRKGDDGTSIWEVDESIAFLLEKLSNKLDENGNTIDALDNDDIATLDEFMKLLIRNIERYKQVKTETKMAELSDIGGRGVTFLRDKIKRDGMFKKKGAIQTINATALTPAYLFDRLGPLKEMYDVLRHNGFDTYIRNEKMIMDRMGEILGDYYKTNKKGELLPGSEAEKWRDDRSAQTIELENGKSITMTAAQMMSLYCLTKRGMQAIGHMCVGGVVVTPIQTGSKIQAAKDRIKNRGTEESTEKRVLTINDIRNIISKLTEDQKNVADQLQSLMSNEMAQLGNEAHRELYGYEMFNEDNYFPIKVYGNERSTDINTIGDVIEKIKSFGFTKPLTPNANKALEIDDIFSVVADHCNGMNLYNAYLVPITDFMKVLNYTHTFEDGEVLTMKEAIEQAYGKDMLKYILNLMKDINGIKSENRGGLEGIMNKALGTAKRTAVFGNVRVALQQPTAIVRAAAEINPKYIKGAMHLDSAKGFIPTVETKTMQEMWKYCPIAQWKAWGYYDTYMGRDIEDVMMNKWSIRDKLLSGYYGQLDNATWSMIWQAVKAEQRDAYPDMDHNSEEFLQLCGRRASEVFDKTQVVDSTFHRSDAMRNKQIAVKLFTAFMAEPTLTMNVFRAGLFNANEASKAGNKGEAAKIRARAISVIVVQAAVVSAAQAFADAWRGKDPGLPWDDDDDEEKIGYWWRWIHNFVYNVFNQAHLENNMYLVKDVTPYINYMISQAADYWNLDPTLRAVMGWDQDYLYSQNNLVFAGLENTATGIQQLFKKLEKGDEYVDYKTKEPKKWYDIIQKIASGIGTFTGLPVGTLMRDFKPFIEKFLPAVYAADTELMDSIAEKMGYQKAGNSTADNVASETTSEESSYSMTAEDLPDNLTDEQKADILKAGEKRSKKAKSSEEQKQLDYDTMLYDALKASSGLEGEEYNKKVYSSVANGMKQYIADGDYLSIGMMRTVIEEAGGDVDYFDKRVLEETKTAYKKSLTYDQTHEERSDMKAMYRYMMSHGMTQEQLSADVLYSSDLAKDMKVAYRFGDNDMIYEAMLPLVDAGITKTDLERLYENRNKMDLSKYKQNGRYKDKLKSMGTFIWPTNGTITSYFGYRNSPTRGASSNHPAIDIGAAMGTEVVAADGGTVIYAGTNGGYGNSVGIKHDNGMVTYYNHLSAWNVKVGDTVAQGQPIANVGSTGISTGPHLDFKILDKNGKPVDPLKYLENKRS